MKILGAILVIVCIVAVWSLYHKLFDVYYFGSEGCLKEIVACILGGVFLAGAIIKFWYIVLIIAVIAIGVYVYKQNT